MYQQWFHEKLKERVLNTYKFSNHDNSKFILLLQKVVYPFEYIGMIMIDYDWEKFNKNIIT